MEVLAMPGVRGKTIDGNAESVAAFAARSTRANLRRCRKAYSYPKGVSGNPSGMSRFYFEYRKIFQENSPELARAAIELVLNTDTGDRVRTVLIVAGLDRAGVTPMDYDPAQDVTPPTWDPGALTPEEREDLKALLQKITGRTRTVARGHRPGHGDGTAGMGDRLPPPPRLQQRAARFWTL
jgi:hypothetical protein